MSFYKFLASYLRQNSHGLSCFIVFIISTTITFGIFFVSAAPIQVNAQTPSPTSIPYYSPGPTSGDIFEDFTLQKIPRILARLACYFVQFAIIIFGVWLLYVGIKFLLSRGDATAYSESKKAFLYSIIGGLVIYGVYTIILTVAGLFGYADLPWIPFCV